MTCSCEPQSKVGGCAICREIETQYCAGIDGAYMANLKGCRDFLSGDPIAYGDTRQQAIDRLNEQLDDAGVTG